VRYLLDTCTISELVRPAPDTGVLEWFAQQDELSLYLSTLSLGELKRGIEKLTTGKRKAFLQRWLTEKVIQRFADRILPLDTAVCLRWGELQAQLEKQGAPTPAIDGLIAATALHHQLTVVTRNTRDMEACGAGLLNPWLS
jgi:predicted nucleic acid-binding protein